MKYPVPRSLGLDDAPLQWEPVPVGESGDEVFRVTGAGLPLRYVKTSARVQRGLLKDEADRMTWLKGRLEVPEVLGYAATPEREWLVTSAIPGLCAFDTAIGLPREEVVRGLATALKRIHAIGVTGCPFDTQRLAAKIADAGRQAAAKGSEAAAEFEAFLARPRPPEDLVFCHGDYCQPNILFHQGRISGFIDLGYAGIADRYYDFGQAVMSLKRNGDEPRIPLFFDAYGLPAPDWDKIEYYQTLEMFY